MDVEKITDKLYLELNGVTENMLIEALRYEFHRHSAATGDAPRAIKGIIMFLKRSTLDIMRRDIDNFLYERDVIIETNGGKPEGIEVYEHDVQPFVELREAIKKETVRRNKEEDVR